jgi:hypothetical protein
VTNPAYESRAGALARQAHRPLNPSCSASRAVRDVLATRELKMIGPEYFLHASNITRVFSFSAKDVLWLRMFLYWHRL